MGCTASTDVNRVPLNQQLNGNVLTKDDHKISLNGDYKQNTGKS